MTFDYLTALSGQPVAFGRCGLFISPTIKTICSPLIGGEKTYRGYLSVLGWEKSHYLKFLTGKIAQPIIQKIEQSERLTAFDVLTVVQLARDVYMQALSLFIPDGFAVSWDTTVRAFVMKREDKVIGVIGRDDFEELNKNVLKLNYIGLNEKPKELKFRDDYAKKLWERVQAYEANAPKEEHPEYEFYNVVSKLCASNSGYTLLTAFDLTVFQLYDAIFQYSYLRSAALNEAIFSNHGGEEFKFEDWMRPIYNK